MITTDHVYFRTHTHKPVRHQPAKPQHPRADPRYASTFESSPVSKEKLRAASYSDAEKMWLDWKRTQPNFKQQLEQKGPAYGVAPSLTKPVDASRFEKDLDLHGYQELRRDLLLQMRLHPESANDLFAMARDHLRDLPSAYRENMRTFLGFNVVSGMHSGALEWQRQLVTRESSGDPEHPSLYDTRGFTDWQAYTWWGGDKEKMVHHLWGRGLKVDVDRAYNNAYRIPPELLMDYLGEIDRAEGLR